MPTPLRASAHVRAGAMGSVLLCAVLLIACGGGDGPSNPPAAVNLTGQWSWSLTGATGGNGVCNVNNVTMSLSQSGSELTGTFAAGGNGNVTCVVGGSQNQTSAFAGGRSLTAVSRTGTSVTFTFGTTAGPWVSSGVINGANSMSGTATVRLLFSGNVVVFTGPWVANRL